MTFSKFGAWGAVVLGLFAAAACGQTASPGSGETHFLIRCDSGGCAGGLECLCGVCSKPCQNDATCSSLGKDVTCVKHDADRCTTVTKSCDVTCADDADCRSVSLRHVCNNGLCRVPPPTLGSIDDGGAANSGSAGGSDSGGSVISGGSATTGGDTGADPGTPVMCDVCGDRICGIRGTCSKQEACKVRGCGGVVFDENGCQRPACESDSDCPDNARCASGRSFVTGLLDGCSVYQGQCACAEPAVGGGDNLKLCAPTAIAGQRGAWKTLRVREWNYQAVNDLTEWVFRSDQPDVEISSYAVHGSATLPPPASQVTKPQVAFGNHPLGEDGAFRLELADPTPCPLVEGYDLDVELELDTATLKKRVSGCAVDARSPFTSLKSLLDQYRN